MRAPRNTSVTEAVSAALRASIESIPILLGDSGVVQPRNQTQLNVGISAICRLEQGSVA